jgi:hypothetical protein
VDLTHIKVHANLSGKYIVLDLLKNQLMRMMKSYRDGCPRLRSVKEERSMDEKLDYYYL